MRMAMTLVLLGATSALGACYGSQTFTGDAGTSDSAADTTADTAWDEGVDTTVDSVADTIPDPPYDVPPDGCGGGSPSTCLPGYFCEVPAGVCDPDDAYGECVEIPTWGCPEYYMPECGCDGLTYGNQCERRQAGVQLMHAGECGTGIACAPWLAECPDGQMCEVPEDSCWLDGVTGTCMPIRDDCGFLWDPVCGCDGTTYANDCERMKDEMWIDHRGECGPACGLPTMPWCLPEQFCEFPTGMCGVPGMQGECIVVPLGCFDYWDPVCGCDGTTYGNDCDRQAARVSLSHRGPC